MFCDRGSAPTARSAWWVWVSAAHFRRERVLATALWNWTGWLTTGLRYPPANERPDWLNRSSSYHPPPS